MHTDATKMGIILRRAREAMKMTQASLAEKIGVSVRTIIAIEKDKRNPTYVVLFRLVHTLEISADSIFHPDSAPLTTEQDQLVRELLSCNEREQRIVMPTVQSLIRALRQDEPDKQG